MKRWISFLFSLTFLILFGHSVLAQGKAEAGFEKLKSLIGDWQGTGPNDLKVSISYALMSGGTAIIETRKPVGEPDMVSIFHLNGDELMMTHYCSAGNQPRMRADLAGGVTKDLSFAFIDATNLSKPTDGHMHGLKYTFLDKDHVSQVWTWWQDGKDNQAEFSLKRIK